MASFTEKIDNEQLVAPNGLLTIDAATGFKATLLEAYKTGKTLIIDLSDVDGADLACLQLICSTCKSARSSGRKVRLGGMSEAVKEAVRTGGYFNAACNDGSCLWT